MPPIATPSVDESANFATYKFWTEENKEKEKKPIHSYTRSYYNNNGSRSPFDESFRGGAPKRGDEYSFYLLHPSLRGKEMYAPMDAQENKMVQAEERVREIRIVNEKKD